MNGYTYSWLISIYNALPECVPTKASRLEIFWRCAARKVHRRARNSVRHTFDDNGNDDSPASFAEKQASPVGYGNSMHIGSESLPSSRKSGDENNSRRIFRVCRQDEKLAEFRYNVNGGRLWKRRLPRRSNKRESNLVRSLQFSLTRF